MAKNTEAKRTTARLKNQYLAFLLSAICYLQFDIFSFSTIVLRLSTKSISSSHLYTVTPRPQAGNDKPRMFRLPQSNAIINRMGFNNKGVDNLVNNVKAANYTGILGINIGKNKDTPNEQGKDDYIHCMRKVFEHASYITVNISSPNTPGLRDLQYGAALDDLLQSLKNEQLDLVAKHGKQVPMLVKIAPDLDPIQIAQVSESLLSNKIDGVIATNTTLERSILLTKPVVYRGSQLGSVRRM